MTEISTKLSSGVAELTRLMARSAARQACLLEAVGAAEDAAAAIINDVSTCARAAANVTIKLRANVNEEVARNMESNNATALNNVKNYVVADEKNVGVTKVRNAGNSLNNGSTIYN